MFYINTIAAPGEKEDTKGRSLHRSNVINSDYATGRHYNGTGVSIAVADDGFVGPHIDFAGRLTNFATGTGQTHGDMTTGIAGGAGNYSSGGGFGGYGGFVAANSLYMPKSVIGVDS